MANRMVDAVPIDAAPTQGTAGMQALQFSKQRVLKIERRLQSKVIEFPRQEPAHSADRF